MPLRWNSSAALLGLLLLAAGAWPAAGASPVLTWSDHFESYPEGTNATPQWLMTGGRWRFEQGTLVGEDCGTDLFHATGALHGRRAWHEVAYSVRFKVESRGSDWRDGPWFGLHCSREGDGYHLAFTDRDCQLHKVVYGVSTSDANALARVPWKPDTNWHTLSLTARGNIISAKLDGRPLFEVKDDAHLNLPSIRRGALCLAARKGSASKGLTRVRFDDVTAHYVEK